MSVTTLIILILLALVLALYSVLRYIFSSIDAVVKEVVETALWKR
jgi:uncharacterized protein YpmB